MRKTLLAVGATALLTLVGTAAEALPIGASPGGESGVTLVYGGCGPYGHRGYWGGCRPGGQWGRPLPGGYMVSCPPGYRLGPAGRACWPMRRW